MLTNIINAPIRVLLIVLVAVAAILLLGTGQVNAQASTDDDEAVDSSQTELTNSDSDLPALVPTEYRYTVQECNNSTLLIRKSLQFYSSSVESVDLSEAQIIYAETNIAQDTNASDLIYPGDTVTVPANLVMKYAESAQSLSDGQLAAWQIYADQASFELEDVVSSNVVVNDKGDVIEVDGDVDPANTDTGSDAANSDTTDDNQASDDNNNALWWIVGGGSVATLWYLLWQRGGSEEE